MSFISKNSNLSSILSDYCSGKEFFMNYYNLRNFYYFYHNYHQHSILCFEECSRWELNMKSNTEKKKKIFYGKLLKNKNNNNFFTSNFYDIFPIDMKLYEHMNFFSNCKKYFLNLEFDLEKNSFILVNDDFCNKDFKITINGYINHISQIFKIYKEDRYFTIYGSEIRNEIYKYFLYNNNFKIICKEKTEENEKYEKFNIIIYKEIIFEFSILILISKENIKKLLKKGIKNISKVELTDYNIQIINLKFNYYIPYVAFLTKQYTLYKNIFNNNNNDNNKKEEKNSMINILENFEQLFPEYFCNIDRFLNCVTPLISENDDIKIIKIFEIFIKPSLYGIPILFKNNKNLTQITFFPILNKIYIIPNLNNSSNTTLTNSNNLNSILTFIDDDNIEYYKKKSYKEQIKNIFKDFDNSLTIKDINEQSFFSLLWIPNQKCFNFFGHKLEKSMNSIEIFYSFRKEKNFSFKMGVIGFIIRDKNGIINYSNQDEIEIETKNFFNKFWFINKSINKCEYNYFDYCKEQKNILDFNYRYFYLFNKENHNFI